MPQKPDSYHRPESLEEALALLAQPGSAPLGGGTKLLATEAGLPGTAVIDLQALGLNQAKLLSANGTQAVAAGATLTLTKFHQFLQAELPDSPATTLLQTAVLHHLHLWHCLCGLNVQHRFYRIGRGGQHRIHRNGRIRQHNLPTLLTSKSQCLWPGPPNAIHIKMTLLPQFHRW